MYFYLLCLFTNAMLTDKVRTAERWLPVEVHSVFQFLTSSVKTPITGLWSLMPYSMLLVYRSCLIFRGYSSSSSSCLIIFISSPQLFSSCSSGSETLGRRRHRILSVQAGLRFLPLNRWDGQTTHIVGVNSSGPWTAV